MDEKADYKKAIRFSKEVLKENCIIEPPINIGEIAENYELSVFVSTFSDRTESGVLFFDEKKNSC